MRTRLIRHARHLLRDDRGQDLLEYALLSAFIGLAGLAALNALSATIGDWYATSNAGVNDLAESPPPHGS
jgi:Flp pilus assembly pilin Flp